MSYRFYNPAPVLMDLLGLEPAAGGTLAFYEVGTTDPKATWSDAAKLIPNANPVQLDSSGRSDTNIWLDGAYSVRLRDMAGQVVWTRDVDSGAGAGAGIPPLENGRFLSTDGSNLIWAPVLEVPDPTGSEKMVLRVVSGQPAWSPEQTIPSPPPPVENSAQWMQAGTLLMAWGSGQAPASGARQTGVTLTFPKAFGADPYYIGITPRNATHTAGGQIGVPAVTAKSPTAFSVQFDTDDFGQSNAQFIAPEPFDWFAVGLAPATPV